MVMARTTPADAATRTGTAGASPSPAVATAPANGQQRSWSQALTIGICAFAVSRLCVLAGAGVRASQVTVDAAEALEPKPGTPVGLITGVLTQWDGLWYLEIVRSGYPRSIPPDITYFQLEARAAFFPLYPLLVRAFDRILPGGDTLAALVVTPRSPSWRSSSSACSPGGCTATTSPSGRWCCSPCSPARSCSPTPTPRRC